MPQWPEPTGPGASTLRRAPFRYPVYLLGFAEGLPFSRALTVAALNAAHADEETPTLLRATLAGLVDAQAGSAGGAPFGSSTRSQAAALLALASTPRGALAESGLDGLADRLIDALLDAQSQGAWSNTQANAFAVVAIARHRAGLRDGAQAVSAEDLQLTVGGVDVGESLANEVLGPTTRRFTLTEDRLARLVGRVGQSGPLRAPLVVRSRSGKPLTVEVRARYRTEFDSAANAPIAAGFTVQRSYSALDGTRLGPDDVIPLGAVVRVRLDVRADAPQQYVAIADRLPAGLEPMGALAGSGSPGSTRGPVDGPAKAGMKLLSHHELRDDRAQFYVDELPRGAVAFTYLARATTPGRFHRPAARVEAMYAPSVTGATAIDVVVVGDEG